MKQKPPINPLFEIDNKFLSNPLWVSLIALTMVLASLGIIFYLSFSYIDSFDGNYLKAVLGGGISLYLPVKSLLLFIKSRRLLKLVDQPHKIMIFRIISLFGIFLSIIVILISLLYNLFFTGFFLFYKEY